jgi:hypothetical protein
MKNHLMQIMYIMVKTLEGIMKMERRILMKNCLKAALLVVLLSLMVSCTNFQEDTVTKKLELEQLVKEQEKQLKEMEESLTHFKKQKERLETQLKNIEESNQALRSVEANYNNLINEYQNFYFDICKEVKNEMCDNQLIYFDPRELKTTDLLFGMKVAEVSVGQYDAGSYIINLEGVTEIEGNYVVSQDDLLGEHIRFFTSQIGEDRVEIEVVIEGSDDTLERLFPNNKGNTKVQIQAIRLSRLPHKPGYNSAVLIEDQQ